MKKSRETDHVDKLDSALISRLVTLQKEDSHESNHNKEKESLKLEMAFKKLGEQRKKFRLLYTNR